MPWSLNPKVLAWGFLITSAVITLALVVYVAVKVQGG